MRAIKIEDGTEVAINDVIISFRGVEDRLREIIRANVPGKDGKVRTDKGQFYARVYGLRIEAAP